MFDGFLIVDKEKIELRDIYLKMKYLNIMFEKYNKRSKLKLLFKKYRKQKLINKMKDNDKDILCSVFKGYKIRANMKRMRKKKDDVENIIEENVKRQINENKFVTITLDNKINSEIIELELDEHYDKQLNDGLESMETGLRNNLKGCELCCCGVGNILMVMWYKIKKCFSS